MKHTLLLLIFTIMSQFSFGQTSHTIYAGNFYYSPSTLTINVGDEVTWINEGGFHDVNGDINSITNEPFNNPETFDSPSVGSGTIYTHTFNIAGDYNYDCSVGSHAENGMVGQITVLANETTVVDIIVGSENHNTLETAVVTAGLVETLSGEGPFTVFAPTDDAFNALPEGTLDAVLADMDLLTSILTHHVAGGSVYSTDLSDGMMVTTLNGTELMVTIDDNGVMIDDAIVTVADVAADNGVVHVIDAVLIPEDGCEDDNETIDELFGAMFVNDCVALVEYLMTNYNYTEYQACNWDGQPMFSLDTSISEICECSCQDVEEETITVVDIIANSENHNTLEYALGEAGFIEYLSGEGPFTVFAPTDDAFDALPEGTLDAVLTDFELLASILKYHVVTESVYSTDLSDGMMVTTLEGSDLTVTIDENGVMINDAMVTVADIEADNGVVHVIDAVLIPENDPYTVVDIIVDSEIHNTLETAVVTAGLVETLSGEGPFTVFAPTDDAFNELPEGTLDAVLADMDLLTSILTHHVAGGSVYSTDLSDGMMVTTLNGTELMVTIDDNGVMIDNAMVTVADIAADNGVVHVIDAVLIPESSNINENLIMNDDKLLYRVDQLGRHIKSEHGLIIELYESGRNVKKYKIK